jgi:glycerol-3-phosphate dehydrogenase subunit C
MLKFEWPLIEPENEAVHTLSRHTFDASEYVVRLAKDFGLAPIDDMPATIGVHFACHARAQNMGPKALEMLRLIPAPNPDAPAFGRKAVIYAGCHDNFNDSTPGEAAIKVLAHNGVLVRVEHPTCCAMPKLENGDLAGVASAAERISAFFAPLIADGWDVVTLTTSCALMLKFEWPLIEPENEAVQTLSRHTFDTSEYVVRLAKDSGLAPIDDMPATIGVHFACHARAQNMGPKALEMLRLIPGAKPLLTERCSGHGGKWGVMCENFERAVRVGTPTARSLVKNKPDIVVSECPLAGPHLGQVMQACGAEPPGRIGHPIEVLAKAYGL